MSSTLLTEQAETQSRTAEELLKENRMKDLALSKATNLIELLNIQLEVQRNSSQQALRELEEQLRERYEKQLRELQQRVQILQRELKRTTANDKTVRSTVLTRANSAKSLENKLKRSSVNKKYTETNPNEDPEPLTYQMNISGEYYHQQAISLEQWRNEIMADFDNLIKSEYNELERLINAIEGANQDFEAISASSRYRQKRDLITQMADIIRAQNKVINSLRAYSQELEDLCKSSSYKLTSLLNKAETAPPLQQIDLKRVVEQIYCVIGIRKQQLRTSFAGLEAQNSELKNILDSMIRLVKEDKGIR